MHRTLRSRLGLTNIAHCGKVMTIIEYRGYQDIDVQFESGEIVKHCQYSNFLTGHIAISPNISRHESYKSRRIGETIIDSNGMKATIINYIDSTNIDVKLEDGSIIRNIRYSKFKSGKLRNNKNSTYGIGYKFKVYGGEEAEIVEIINGSRAIIRFEDGVTKNVSRSLISCKCVHIKHPNSKRKRPKKINIGDKDIMQNGLLVECIEHREIRRDIFRFIDGTEINKDNRQFKLHNIEHPKYTYCELVTTYNSEDYYLCTCRKCKGKHMLKLSEMKDFECTEEIT